MKIWSFFITLAISLPAFSLQKNQEEYNAFAAKATASFINRMDNVGDFLGIASKHISPEQMENLKKQLTMNGVTEKSKFPKVKYDGNKVYFDKQNYIMYIDYNTINVNGFVFKKSIKGVDVFYKDVMKTLKKKNASFSILPKAHAMGDMMSLLGLGASFAGGYFLGPSLLGVSPVWGGVIGAGMFYVGNELYHSIRSGGVSCKDGYYMYRSKERDGLFGIMAGSKKTALDQATLEGIFGQGRVPPCTPASAKMVENGISNFGKMPQPMGYPPYGGSQIPTDPRQPYPPPQPADVTQ